MLQEKNRDNSLSYYSKEKKSCSNFSCYNIERKLQQLKLLQQKERTITTQAQREKKELHKML